MQAVGIAGVCEVGGLVAQPYRSLRLYVPHTASPAGFAG